MAQNNRNSSPYSSASPSSPNQENFVFGHEMRIQIEENENPTVQNTQTVNSTADFSSIRNATGAVQQNISSIFNQARSELQRRTGQTRMWATNFNTVLQGVRRQSSVVTQQAPLSQQDVAETVNDGGIQAPQEHDHAPQAHVLLGNEVNSNNSLENSNSRNGSPSQQNNSPTVVNNGGSNDIHPTEDRTSNSSPMSGNGSPVRSRSEHSSVNLAEGIARSDSVNSNNRQHGSDPRPEDGAFAELFAQVPELRQFLFVVSRYIPFVLILLLKSLYDHFDTFCDIAFTFAIVYYFDASLQKQVARQSQPKRMIFLRDICFLFLILVYVFGQYKDYYNLWLIRNLIEPISLATLLYSVCITDNIIKMVTILVKNFVAALPVSVIHYNRRGRFYMLIEAVSQLYRYFAPVQLWLVFMRGSYPMLIRSIGSILYMIPKLAYLVDPLKLLKKALVMFPRKVKYGSIPTKEDIENSGDQCAICHDRFDSPVLLQCNHIFCENCIGSWFRSETTCPMCRAKVVDDMSWLDGRTTQFVQLF